MLTFSLLLTAAAGGAQEILQADYGPSDPTPKALSRGRIIEMTGSRLQPYRVVSACPAGTRPFRIDRPMKGDMYCRKLGEKNRKPAIFVPWGDPFEPYKRVPRCPEGTHPVRTDWPLKGDMTCAKDEGAPPALYLRTGDEYNPIYRVPLCPDGTREKATDWPGTGDRACEWEKKEGGPRPAAGASSGDGRP